MPCAKFGWNWPSGSSSEYFTQGYFVPSLLEIGPVLVVLEKKMKRWKVHRLTDDRQ